MVEATWKTTLSQDDGQPHNAPDPRLLEREMSMVGSRVDSRDRDGARRAPTNGARGFTTSPDSDKDGRVPDGTAFLEVL